MYKSFELTKPINKVTNASSWGRLGNLFNQYTEKQNGQIRLILNQGGVQNRGIKSCDKESIRCLLEEMVILDQPLTGSLYGNMACGVLVGVSIELN